MHTLNDVTRFNEDYAKVFLFGHSMEVGVITSVEIGGMNFLEVVALDRNSNAPLHLAKTKYYGQNAIFAIELLTMEEYSHWINPPEVPDLPF